MEKLYPLITGGATAFGTGWVFQKEIDEINILQATKKAFAEAYRNALAHCPGDYVCSDVFVDAVKDLDIPAVQHSLIHGDALCYSIAAASIVAKVERDRYMIASYSNCVSKSFPTAAIITKARINCAYGNAVS